MLMMYAYDIYYPFSAAHIHLLPPHLHKPLCGLLCYAHRHAVLLVWSIIDHCLDPQLSKAHQAPWYYFAQGRLPL